MGRLQGTRARLRLLFARRAAESRMDEEIRFHVEMETGRLVREAGLDPAGARRRALVAFGGVERCREEMRDGRGLAWLGGLLLDLRLGWRMLLKYPGLSLVGMAGMAVAVAIGTFCFSIIYTLVGTTVPLDDGGRVVAIHNMDPYGRDVPGTHLQDLAAWRESLPAVEEFGAYRVVDRNLITPGGRPEPVRVAEMTASGFRVARVPGSHLSHLVGPCASCRPPPGVLLDGSGEQGRGPVRGPGGERRSCRRFRRERGTLARCRAPRDFHIGIPYDSGSRLRARDLWLDNRRLMVEKRDVQPGTLALMILKTLEVLGPLHGYGVARRIEETSGNRLTLNYGTLYPALLKLEQEGFVTAEWGQSENNRRAKFYSLTPAGRKQLAREAREWQQTAELIAAFFALKPGAA